MADEISGELSLMGTGDDLTTSLQAAALLMSDGFDKRAGCTEAGLVAAAEQVTAVADVFVRWLRKLHSISLEWKTIESEATGEVIAPIPGGTTMALILTGQRARAVINAADSRNFPVDATLAVKVTDADGGASSVATAEIVEATSGTASGKDELLVHVGDAAGSALVTVYDPANPDTVFGSLAVDVAGNPDDIAHIDLSEAVIEDDVPTP